MGLLADNKDVIATLEVPKTASIAAAQRNPPWGVDRSDQNPGGATYDSAYTYNYPMDGTGVHVYIIDTVSWIRMLKYCKDGTCFSRNRVLGPVDFSLPFAQVIYLPFGTTGFDGFKFPFCQ